MPSLSKTQPSSASGERRIYPRAELDVPALFDAEFSHGRAQCRDISVGGMAVDAERALPIGTVVQIYFELPTGISVDENAEVVRGDGQKLALRFVRPSARSHAAIRSYVLRQIVRTAPDALAS